MLREWILAFLTSLSADPAVLEQEAPKAAAAVAFAYAALAQDPVSSETVAPPAPPVERPADCKTCPPGARR